MYQSLKFLFKKYFEIIAFTLGLILLALMDPEAFNGSSFCLFEQLGITFCPGDGLGHSISYVFRGDFASALEYNVLGPFAIIILAGRIIQLLFKNRQYSQIKL
jgi:hypothetical protein